jgi:hypothetical protein
VEVVRSRQAKRAFVAAWLVALAAAGAAGPSRACDAAPGTARTAGAQGTVIHRDPANGKPTVQPPDTAPHAAREVAPSALVALRETRRLR